MTDKRRSTCPACGSVRVTVTGKWGQCDEADCRHRGAARRFRPDFVQQAETIHAPAGGNGGRRASLDFYDRR